MLKQLFKLKPEDYETLYNGELVTITKGSTTTTLLLNTETYALTVNSGTPLSTNEYSIEVSDKYLTPDNIEDMFDDLDTVATPQEVADLFGTVTPESRQLIVDLIYPIGSIYMTNKSEAQFNPNTAWGGTWEKIEGKFLLSSSSNYALGSTGGEAAHTLTVDEMPSHGNHLYENGSWVGHGNVARDMEIGTLTEYGTDGRGWFLNYGNETYPAGEYVGGGGSHNNMPPYIVVTTWQRIA